MHQTLSYLNILLLEIHHISQKPLDLHIADCIFQQFPSGLKLLPPSHCQDMPRCCMQSSNSLYSKSSRPSCCMNTSTNPPCSHWCFPRWKPNDFMSLIWEEQPTLSKFSSSQLWKATKHFENHVAFRIRKLWIVPHLQKPSYNHDLVDGFWPTHLKKYVRQIGSFHHFPNKNNTSIWWFQPIWKILVKLDHFLR